MSRSASLLENGTVRSRVRRAAPGRWASCWVRAIASRSGRVSSSPADLEAAHHQQFELGRGLDQRRSNCPSLRREPRGLSLVVAVFFGPWLS